MDHFAGGANDSGSDLDISDVSSVISDLSDGWKDDFEAREGEFSEETHEFIVPPCNEISGAQKIGDDVVSELDFFSLLVPAAMIDNLVEETNCYADQRILIHDDPKWEGVTAPEMRAYIGLNILIAIHQLPHIDHYWSTDDLLGIYNDYLLYIIIIIVIILLYIMADC